MISQVFSKSLAEIASVLRQIDRRADFDDLMPEEGWIAEYVRWTRQTEPPTAFHFFVAATVIGSALGRSISFDKGAYKVFPNLCVMIIAPTGRCRKTSACNLGTRLLAKVGGTVLADKTTPEAFVDALKTQVNATGLIYAPELAVFLGKQKYQEGMVPLLTALFDCPDEWVSKTIGRGDTSLTNVALSALLCSTADWLKTSIPADSFGGGFMSRFLFVIQNSTPRSFPLPPPLDPEIRKILIAKLSKIKAKRGMFTLTPHGDAWYRNWYDTRAALAGDKRFAGYFERKPDHMLRVAMIMKIAAMTDEKDLVLNDKDLMYAERILGWLEAYLPGTFDQLTSSATGEDHARILRDLRSAGGTIEHSALLRSNSSHMNAEQFKRAMATLRDSKLVAWNAVTKEYILEPIAWDL
jgi:hypothetical protein